MTNTPLDPHENDPDIPPLNHPADPDTPEPPDEPAEPVKATRKMS